MKMKRGTLMTIVALAAALRASPARAGALKVGDFLATLAPEQKKAP